jgi:hypothetical protein
MCSQNYFAVVGDRFVKKLPVCFPSFGFSHCVPFVHLHVKALGVSALGLEQSIHHNGLSQRSLLSVKRSMWRNPNVVLYWS